MKKYIFLHIPKNAGTTLHNVLECNWSTWSTFHIKYPRSISLAILSRLPVSKLNEICFIKGHQPFGIHRIFENSDEWQYFTMVRDPVRRVVSELAYIRRNHPDLIPSNLDDIDIVRNYSIFHNAQTRFIAGDDVGLNDESYSYTSCAGEVYNRSINNLNNKFVYVGLVEEFDDSLSSLAASINLRFTGYMTRNADRTGRNSSISSSLEAAILDYNRDDAELYRRAKAGEWGFRKFTKQVKKLEGISLVDRGYMTYRRIICRIIWSMRWKP